MEKPTLGEQKTDTAPSRPTKLGRAVRRVIGLRDDERREQWPEETGREFFAALTNGTLVHVTSEVLKKREDYKITKKYNEVGFQQSVVTFAEGNVSTHVLISQDVDESGNVIPAFRAVRSWFDSAIHDTHVTEPFDFSDPRAFDVDDFGSAFVLTLKRGTTVSTLEFVNELPEGVEGSLEDPRDHDLKLVLDKLAVSRIPQSYLY